MGPLEASLRATHQRSYAGVLIAARSQSPSRTFRVNCVEMLKICVIHNLNRGGARRRLSEQLSRFDGDVHELCPSTAFPITEDAVVQAVGLRAARVPRLYRAPLRYIDAAAALRCWGAIADQLARIAPDVVYANPCQFFQAPAALLHDVGPSLYFCDEPRRVDHDPLARTSRRQATRLVYAPLYRAERTVDQRATSRASAVATNSHFSALQIHGAYGRDAAVVPMGVMAACVGIRSAEPRHLLSVGTLIPTKRHDLVIRSAACSVGNWPVVVVAPRSEASEEARLRGIAADVGVDLDLRIGISDRALAETYAAAHATLYLAEREPLGLASLEAQAAGCPVIVANDGGLPETIVPGVSGWIAEREPHLIAELIDQLNDRDVRREMSTAARDHSAAWDWQRSATVIEEMLTAVAGRA
jgi:glycosyltransferase involved in cell wall biosynthesis